VVRFLSFGLSGDYGSLLYAGCVGDCRDTWLAVIGHANQILLCKDFCWKFGGKWKLLGE
jgi:hypothetical protein